MLLLRGCYGRPPPRPNSAIAAAWKGGLTPPRCWCCWGRGRPPCAVFLVLLLAGVYPHMW